MRIIINGTGTKATGATQVTVSFVRECIKFTQHKYYLFLSATVISELSSTKFPENFFITVFDYKPFFNHRGRKTWKKLIELEKEIKPDCVFTIFGPSVWQPKAPHLMGYAYPYYVYPESPFFDIISNKLKFKIKLYEKFHKFYFQKNGKHYVCETQDVTDRLPKYIKCNSENIFTVTNTYSDFFNNFTPGQKNFLPPRENDEFRFVSLSSFATHKNLKILNKVIPLLKNKTKTIKIKFVLTLNTYEFEKHFTDEAKELIINLGRIKVEECPQVFHESDAMFLPTLMECFSASYAEAMKMKKPIVTSDLPFAHAVCNQAAIYFNPIDPSDIANKIFQIVSKTDLRNKIILNGIKQLKTFDTPQSRALKYLSICQKISEKYESK